MRYYRRIASIPWMERVSNENENIYEEGRLKKFKPHRVYIEARTIGKCSVPTS